MHRKITDDELMKKVLRDNSFLSLEHLYSQSTINKLNNEFDDIFSTQNKARRYVDVLDIYNLGLIEDIFTPQLISLIFTLIPNPVLYHCHSYEIEGLNSKSHICENNFLDGWHRDVDCIHDLDKKEIQHVSLFIYLTNVGEDDGAFEICDKKLGYFPRLFKSSGFYRITGSKGHSFLFNRTAMHRASPNKNATERRVLKISFQSKDSLSHALDTKSVSHAKGFKLIEVQKRLPKENLVLRSLFGDLSIHNLDISEAIKGLVVSAPTTGLDTREMHKINTNINLLQEFRGYAKDLVYIKNLISYKIKGKFSEIKNQQKN